MFEKFKSHINKKYTTISVYVIITVAIIFALGFATTRIGIIFKTATDVLFYLLKIFTPVFIGVVIAYIIDPMVNFTEKLYSKSKIIRFKNQKKYRSLAVFSCIIGTITLIFVLVGLFIFSITKEIANIKLDQAIALITNYINSFSDSLSSFEGKLADLNIVKSNAIDQYISQLSTSLINGLKDFTNNLAGSTKHISSYASNIVFGLIIGIYLLLDKEDFKEYCDKFSRALFTDKMQNRIKNFWEDFNRIFSGYIRGQLLDSLFMCIVLSICLTIIGIKFGMLIGVLAGLCNLIPYFGPIVAFVGTILFGMLNGQYTQVIIAIVVLLIVQQIDGNIIGPKLLGKSVSLKPIFILVAVLIGSQIAGVLGMVLAVPVAGIIKLFIKRHIDERLRKKEAAEHEAAVSKE
ncbi:AI-2E family transporter [Clostridium oryzae]|uniref:Pheromone autoinducer 2 transporter n=1 Tax=Clostridium oryzae TaxID=1450648 RepID=A0A1V4IC65_9CLOT|nr:AI-2E family transporter [Clostridium oryzae]OPJ57598.1 pheromone autoinducer 2 transporter [Clostridium oryzae]